MSGENRRQCDATARTHVCTPAPPRARTPIQTILLCLLMIYFFVYGGTFQTSLTGVGKLQGQVITTVLWVTLLIALALNREMGRLYASLGHPVVALMGLLAIGLLISSHQSFFPRFSYEVSFQTIWYLGIAWLTCLYCRSEEHRERVITAVLVGGSVVLVFALAQFAGWFFDPHRDTSAAGQRMMKATMNSHNDLAGFLVLLLPLALARFLPRSDAAAEPGAASPGRFIYGVLSILTLFAIVFTYSRCGWVGAVAEIVVFAAIAFRTGQFKSIAEMTRSQRPFLIGAAVLLLAALFFSPHQWFLERVKTMLTGSDYGSTSRLLMWKHLIAAWRDRPVWGWGSGLLPIVYPRYLNIGDFRELIFHAHNIVLQYLVDSGGVGLSLFLATIGAGLWTGLRAIRPEENIQAARRQTALIAALLGFLAYSLFNCSQAIPAITGTFWILVGVTISKQARRPRGVGVSLAVGCLTAIGLAWLLLLSPSCNSLLDLEFSSLGSTRAQLLFDQAMASPDPASKIALLNKAIHINDQFFFYSWVRDVIEFRNGKVPFAVRVDKPPCTLYGACNDALACSNRMWMWWKTRSEKTLSSMVYCFDHCIRSDPTLPQYRLSKALVLLHSRATIHEAEKELATVVSQMARKPPVTWLILGQIQERRGQWDEALKTLQAGIEQAKRHDPLPGYQMQIRYRRIGLADESVDALPDLYSEDLLNWELAKVLDRLGKSGEAGKYRAQAMRLNPQLKVHSPQGYVWENLNWEKHKR